MCIAYGVNKIRSTHLLLYCSEEAIARNYLGALRVPRLDRHRPPSLQLLVRRGALERWRGSGGLDVTCRILSDSTNSPFSSCSPSSSSSLESISASGGSLLDIGVSSHERPSEDLLFRNDLRSLSTKRVWNLFKLLWLSVDAGFGGLLPALALLGLVISEVCEVRDELRENCGLEARCDIYIGWLRWRDGDPAINSLPGDVDKLGQSDREPSETFRERQELLFEHSETRRWRPL